jgi:predicted phosphodiesterase
MPKRSKVVAAIYDIHGNLPALEAVLLQIETADVDRIIVGGDVVPGPMPHEALDRLRRLTIPVDFIHGNGEIAVLQFLAGEKPAAMPERVWPLIEWNAQKLSAADRELIRKWPRTFESDIEGLGRVLFCHATPRSETEIFTKLTSNDRLRNILAGIEADIIVCGHTHMQFDRTIDGIRIINSGSVGMPFGERGAHWLLLGPEIQFRRTEYDFENAAARIRATDYPQAEVFAATNILNPPSADQMLETFAKAEPAAGN